MRSGEVKWGKDFIFNIKAISKVSKVNNVQPWERTASH